MIRVEINNRDTIKAKKKKYQQDKELVFWKEKQNWQALARVTEKKRECRIIHNS